MKASPIKTAFLIAATSLGAVPSAFATFIVDQDPGGVQLNLDNAQDVSSFQGFVGTDLIQISAVGNANAASGNATITPANQNTTLTTLTFTPADPNLFSDFSFRGQLEREAGGEVVVTVQDNQGNPPQTFTFTGLGANGDFSRIGIVSLDGETIQSVTLASIFKQQKQTEFSSGRRPVPTPDGGATAMLLGLALSGLGLIRRK